MDQDKNKEEDIKTKKPKWQKSYFDVLGICCTSEIPIIENILKSLDGVKEYSVIVPSRTVIVVHDSLLISPFQIAKALNQARLEANVKVNGETNYKNKWPSPFAVVSGLLLLLSFLKFVYPPLRWIAVAAVAAGIYPILAKAFASIRRLRVDINILVIITVIATLAMQDYMEAAAVVFLFTIAEWLETRASYKATSVMQSLMSLAPQKAIIAETGEEVEVDDVNVDTVLAVKTGETIPIDGIVVNGNCEVDEKTLTGEAFPVVKQKDSTVWAGTINLNGYITMKTTSLASDSVVAKMAKLVEEAQSSKTKSQRLIDKCSQYYTPAIIIISAGFAIIPAIMKVHNLNHWFHLALVVLVSACPCGLILSTPVATFCALTKAATSGLLIKSADYLDTLSKIKTVAFDKTGTITRGEFIVVDFKSLSSNISLHSLIYWVSSVESKSSHPMAATLVDYAKSVSIEPKPEAVEHYESFPGEGIYGKIDGKDIYIGNKRIASRAMCSSVSEIEIDTKGGKTIGYVYVNQTLAGVFNLSDACRSGVAQAMKELKDLGIKTAMLTGDNQESATQAQEELGNAIDVVHGDLLPQDKSKIIKEFKKDGKTAMVGDGVNDAPALANADIGISMGISGSALATQTGHIILMSNDIRRIPQAIRLARRAQNKVVQNVVLSIILKVGILVLAFAGHPLIWAAVLVDVGTCLLVILNSMLLLQDKDRTKNKKCYRGNTTTSLLKLEGDSIEEIDLEAGLLSKSQCKTGCCGDKNTQKKAMTMKRESTKASSDDHCHSSSCGDNKKHQDNVKLVKDSCCGEKSKKPEVDMVSLSSFKKHTHVNNGLTTSCCPNKNKKVEEIVAKSCCEKKKQAEENTARKILGQEITEMETKVGEISKSRCCGNTKKVNETALLLTKETVKQSCHEKPCLDIEAGESCDLKLVCCGDKEGEVRENLDLEKGLKIKSEGQCKSDCCGDEKETEEITLASDQEETDSVDCSSRCCGDKEEEVRQVCNESQDISVVSGDFKTLCCGTSLEQEVSPSCCNNEEPEIAKVSNQSCCNTEETEIAEVSSQSCCNNEEPEIAKVSSQSCCNKEKEIEEVSSQSCCTSTSPSDVVLSDLEVKKVETCCKVKSEEEACGSKCSEKEKRRVGKSCCRSYAKEYCSHRHGHHHHHNHHHHHVGAA
ncbi:unnamed protein product [Cochlearia groenlandica]